MLAAIEMKFSVRVILPALAAVALACCAYVRHGKTEEIAVRSEPSGANVTMSSGMTGVTPFTITVARERDLVFHFSKPGYRSTDVFDDAQVESGYVAADWASMLVTGIPVAWLSDVSSGSAHTHELTTITATLEPDPSYSAPTMHPSAPEPEAAPSTAQTSKK